MYKQLVSNKIPSWSSPAYLYQDQQDGMETGFSLPSPVTGMKGGQQELSWETETLETRPAFQPLSDVCAKDSSSKNSSSDKL